MLDTDPCVSYLFSTESEVVVVEVFRAAFDGTFQLVVSTGQLQELGNALRNSPLLQDRISADLLVEL
jgi:hypothetical protein